MAVGIHRDADLAVAEDLHHHARVDALHKQQRGAGMAKVVEASMGTGHSETRSTLLMSSV